MYCQKCCVADNSEFSHLKGVAFKIYLNIIMVNIEYNTPPSTVHTAQAPCVTKSPIHGKLWNTPPDNHMTSGFELLTTVKHTNKPEIGELEEHQRTHEPRKNSFLQQGYPQLLCTMPREYHPVLCTFYNTVLTYPKIEITNFFPLHLAT